MDAPGHGAGGGPGDPTAGPATAAGLGAGWGVPAAHGGAGLAAPAPPPGLGGAPWDDLPSAVLYTIVPLAYVLAGWEAEALRPLHHVAGPGGVTLAVRQGPAGPVIERVLSTRPSDFLRPELMPGRPPPSQA